MNEEVDEWRGGTTSTLWYLAGQLNVRTFVREGCEYVQRKGQRTSGEGEA